MNRLCLLVPYELGDQAAAQLSELLNDLAFTFDGQYFAQIRRYYDQRRHSEPPGHHRQLELFEDDDREF